MRLRNNLLEISCCFISYVLFSHLYLKMPLCVKEDDSEKFCLLCETKTVCACLVSCFPQAPSRCACLCCSWRIILWNPTVFGNLKGHNHKKNWQSTLDYWECQICYEHSHRFLACLWSGSGRAMFCGLLCCLVWLWGVFRDPHIPQSAASQMFILCWVLIVCPK